MKVIIGFVVLCLAAFGICYATGLFDMEAPGDQAAKFKSSVKEGMNWTEVAKLREPKKFHAISSKGLGGKGAEQKFDYADFEKRAKAGEFADGFTFEYRFAADIFYEAVFDPKGDMIDLVKLKTMADLLPAG